MPAYNAANPPNLAPGQVIVLWSAESPAPGTGTTAASQQVSLTSLANRAGAPFGVDFKFSAAPGVFEVDVQAAAVDVDTNYASVSNGVIAAVDATNNTAHMDFVGTAKYMRLLLRTRTNAVSITATVTGG